MIEVDRKDINRIKMATNPPDTIVNAGMRCITNNKVYYFDGIRWVEEREATKEDIDTGIPVLI